MWLDGLIRILQIFPIRWKKSRCPSKIQNYLYHLSRPSYWTFFMAPTKRLSIEEGLYSIERTSSHNKSWYHNQDGNNQRWMRKYVHCKVHMKKSNNFGYLEIPIKYGVFYTQIMYGPNLLTPRIWIGLFLFILWIFSGYLPHI